MTENRYQHQKEQRPLAAENGRTQLQASLLQKSQRNAVGPKFFQISNTISKLDS